MGTLLLELVPFAVGLAATPAAVAVGIMFLTSNRPVANAVAFAVAFAVVYVVLSTLVLVIVHASPEPLIDQRVKAVVTLVVGLLLLVLAISALRRHDRLDQPRRSGFMARAEHATPRQACTLGLVLAVVNPNVPILFAGLATISAAGATVGASVAGVLLLLLGAEIGLLGPVLWYLAGPARATSGLARVKNWLGRHEKAVELAVLVVFGLVFTVKGVAGLW